MGFNSAFKGLSIGMTPTRILSCVGIISTIRGTEGSEQVAVFLVCIPWPFDHNWALQYTVCREYTLQTLYRRYK